MNNLVAQKIAEIASDLSITATRGLAQGDVTTDESFSMRMYVENLRQLAETVESRSTSIGNSIPGRCCK